MTFGLLLSRDGGLTWNFMCNQAVGFSGLYDPDYSPSSTGALYATTFDGLKVMRDGCTFAATTMGTTFVSQTEIGGDQAVYATAADPSDAKIYKSTNDGTTFPTSAAPGMNNDWWDSLVVAPSNPMRIYLTGYRLQSGLPKVLLVFRSSDGGASFVPMSIEGITASANSSLNIVGIDASNPDIIYAKGNLEDGNVGDSIYRSTNGGGTVGDPTAWTKILSKQDPFGLSFLVRSNGMLIAATQTSGMVVSTDSGVTWTAPPCAPHISCLAENPSTHEVWACTHNYDPNGDGAGIMKSSDLATWYPVLRFQDIAGPVLCPTGTIQHDACTDVWTNVQSTLSSMPPTAPACSPPIGTDGGLPTMSEPTGCCSASGGEGSIALVAVVGLGLSRRRQRAGECVRQRFAGA